MSLVCAQTGRIADVAIGDGPALGQLLPNGRVEWSGASPTPWSEGDVVSRFVAHPGFWCLARNPHPNPSRPWCASARTSPMVIDIRDGSSADEACGAALQLLGHAPLFRMERGSHGSDVWHLECYTTAEELDLANQCDEVVAAEILPELAALQVGGEYIFNGGAGGLTRYTRTV